MPAYLIAIRKGPVRDAEAMAEYQRRTRQIGADIKLLPRVVYGDIQSLEGDAPDGVVVIEFATLEDARAWYHSEAYRAAIPFRQRAADYDVFVVEGIGGQTEPAAD
jgi:uncharacterized protein (DUF1330 family)